MTNIFKGNHELWSEPIRFFFEVDFIDPDDEELELELELEDTFIGRLELPFWDTFFT